MIEELKEKALVVFNAIFEGKKSAEIEGVEYPIEKFSSGIKHVDLFGYRFIEQNRNKPSEWGKKAKEGRKIMWIMKGRTYLARIFDGEFINLKKSAK